jgi:predicted acyltransferase (DUF342 family)
MLVIGDISLNSGLSVAKASGFSSTLWVGDNVVFASGLQVSNDISGGNRLFIKGDASMNSRLIVQGDLSLNSNVYVGKDVMIGGNLSVKQYSTNLTVYTVSYEFIVAQDMSLNGRLFLYEDLSANKRMFVGGDASFGGKLFVKGDVSMNGYLYANYPSSSIPSSAIKGGVTTDLYNIDISTNCRLYVNGDTSMNGMLSVAKASGFTSTLYVGDNVQFAAGLQVSNDISGGNRLFIKGDASMNSRLIVQGDVSLNSRLYLFSDASFGGKLFVQGDVSMNGYLYANYPSSSIPSTAIKGGVTTDLYNIDISTNCRLYVNGDTSMNGMLSVRKASGFTSTLYVGDTGYFAAGLTVINDISGSNRLLIKGDASLNNRLIVDGDVSLNQRLYVLGDASFNKRVFVSSDLSVNGNLYGNVNTISSLIVSNNINMNGVVAQFGGTVTVPTTYTSYVNLSDYITQYNLNSYTTNDVNIYTRLYVDNDVSFNSNLRIKGTTASTSTTTGALIVTGGVGIAGNCIAGSLSTSSDYRIKKNVIPLNANFIVDNLNPVHYYNRLTDSSDIGFIAHEVQEEYPYLVKGEKDGNDYQSLNYNGIIGILVNEIKELKKENHTMKDEIQKIKKILYNIPGYNLDEK